MNELMQKMQQLDTLKNEVSFLRKSADAKFISLTVSDCSGLTVTPFGQFDTANLFTELFDCKENEDLLREYISKVAERADIRRQEIQAEVSAMMIEEAVGLKQDLWPQGQGATTGRVSMESENRSNTPRSKPSSIIPGEPTPCAVGLSTGKPTTISFEELCEQARRVPTAAVS